MVYVYAKFDGCTTFRGFDLNEGAQVNNLIYASVVEDNQETRGKLQQLADLNKSCHLVLQLRTGKGNITYQTK